MKLLKLSESIKSFEKVIYILIMVTENSKIDYINNQEYGIDLKYFLGKIWMLK